MKTLETIYDDSRKRRVIVFQRDDGSFGFDEERFSDEPLEMAWLPYGPDCRCDSAERALSEAHGRVPWLAEVTDRTPNPALHRTAGPCPISKLNSSARRR
jgi:hypothetical protein